MNHHNRDVELKWKDLGDNGINSSLSIRTARREGLPPMMSLPASQIEASSSQGPVLFSMAETEQTVETSCPDLISAEVRFQNISELGRRGSEASCGKDLSGGTTS